VEKVANPFTGRIARGAGTLDDIPTAGQGPKSDVGEFGRSEEGVQGILISPEMDGTLPPGSRLGLPVILAFEQADPGLQ
jgi:hypothetical protein